MGAELLSLGEEILSAQDLLMTIDAEILLPRIGGYNARPYSMVLRRLEFPRSSELKALWRWWMRVALSAAYRGSKEYSEIEKFVGELLGSTGKQSCFTLTLEPVDEKEWEKISRMHNRVNLVKQLLDPEGIIMNIAKKILELSSAKGLNCSVKLTPPVTITFRDRGEKELEFLRKLNELKSKLNVEFRESKRRGKVDRVLICIDSSEKLERLIKSLELSISQDLLKTYGNIVNMSNISRIKLILQPRREEDNEFNVKISEGNERYLKRIIEDLASLIEERLHVKISIFLNRKLSNNNETLLQFAISTLFIALIFGGHGSIARRGFGSIIIKSPPRITTISDNDEHSRRTKILNEEVGLLEKVLRASRCEDFRKGLAELINHVIDLAKIVVASSSSEPSTIPKVPTLDSNYFRFEVFKCQRNADPIELLKIIGEATLKNTWKGICGWNIRNSGGSFHTWILGLPRKVKRTGYFIDTEEVRRVSAICFKVFENISGEKFIIVYGFLSRDWPTSTLTHKGKNSPKGKHVKELGIVELTRSGKCTFSRSDMTDDKFIEKVFNSAFKFVTTYLKEKIEIEKSI